jgi:WD40 repeat protein
VALTSFERGLSHVFGQQACSEEYVRAVAMNWMPLADPSFLKSAAASSITNQQFFDFATNRLHVPRRLLEVIAESGRKSDEEENSLNQDSDQPTASSSKNQMDLPSIGDQWLANPPWKKTAEKMIPSGIQHVNAPPAESLLLQWCHGYRGYDCRNNIHHLPTGSSSSANNECRYLLFYAAGLLIAQGYRHPNTQESQSFFSLHTDDVIALAIAPYQATDNKATIASGEIGKSPAIHISTWSLNEGDGSHRFDSRFIIQGFHSQGISHLAFSSSGGLLFSIGVNYSIAAYDISSTAAPGKYGRMIYSTQGPKEKVMHLCHGLDGDHFLSCGEKHIIFWKANHASNSNPYQGYQQCAVKLGQNKSKTFLSCVAISKGYAVGSADGDLFLLQANDSSSSDPLILLPLSKAQTQCHDKGIPALWSSPDGLQVISGGKDGRIILWEVAISSSTASSSQQASVISMQQQIVSSSPLTTSSIRAMSISQDLRSMIVGTIKCELIEWRNHPTASLEGFLSRIGQEADKSSSRTIMVAHAKDEVWGLATRFRSLQYASTGDDGYLRIWDAMLNKQVLELDLAQAARSCCYSSDGIYLAVGLGIFSSTGSTATAKSKSASQKSSSAAGGSIRVYRHEQPSLSAAAKDAVSLSLVIEIKEAKGAITAIKFSPDNNILAAGSKDGAIYFYSSIQQFKQKSKFSKHNSAIVCFDFSADGKYLQSCCQAYEILFCDVATGNQIFGSSLMDVSWKTWTCSLGWAVMGIWSGTMDGSDVNAVDRSPSGRLLANGDDFSHVNLYRFPALEKDKGNQHNTYSGHSSHVTNVRWIDMGDGKDECLISCGGADKCVFVWKVVGSNDSHISIIFKNNSPTKDLQVDDVELGFDDHGPTGGDEFLAVKPWLSAIVQPSAWSNPDASKLQAYQSSLFEIASLHQQFADQARDRSYEDLKTSYRDIKLTCDNVLVKHSESGYLPDISAPFDSDELIIEHIHGYRGDCRNNVFAVNDGDTRYIIYPAAAVVVVNEGSSQRYFRGHTDDVLSLAVHGSNAASGQQGVGTTYVWDVSSLKALAVIKTKQKNVQFLCFTSDGRLLAALGGDNSLHVHDWQSNVAIAWTKLDGATSYHLLPISSSSNAFAISGDKFIKVWTLAGRNLSGSRTITSAASSKPLQYLCMANISTKLLFGAEDGYVYVSADGGKSLVTKFDHFKDRASISKNDSAIVSMSYSSQHYLFITGAKNGSISVWSCEAFESATITGKGSEALPTRALILSIANIPGLTNVFAKAIHSLFISDKIDASGDLSLIIGTRGCDLIEILFKISSDSPSVKLKQIITRGHCNDEVWGLATHPTRPEYATTGDDKTLRFFATRQTHQQIAAVPLGNMSRCCAYSPDGSYIAVGFGGRVGKGKVAGDGLVRVYSTSTFEQVAERHDAKQWISDVKFSGDGRTIIICSHDCKVYMYDWSSEKKSLSLRCNFTKHHAAVSHVDISTDGQYFQSTCNAYELLYGECLTGKQVPHPHQLKDMKWDSWTLPLGWPVQGIWAPGMDGTDINSVSRSHSGNVVATGDDYGHVNLFRLPCLDPKAIALKYGGIHSSHVSNVRWTVGDEYLISCGGNDRCVMVWKHKVLSTAAIADGPSTTSASAAAIAMDDIDMIEAPSGGDEFLAVKPWLGAIRAPPYPPSIDKSAPNISCGIKWIFGYTSYVSIQNNKVANNLAYNSDGGIVYPAASLAVSYSPSTSPASPAGSQRYFQGHDDDILSLATSYDRRIIATGQVAAKSTNKNTKGNAGIMLWDVVDTRCISSLPACHQRGVAQLSFSPDNTQLVSVGMDDQQTHILWVSLMVATISLDAADDELCMF